LNIVSKPRLRSRSAVAGARRPRSMAAFSVATTAGGVFAGTKKPIQELE
jgi:hypothetical protein